MLWFDVLVALMALFMFVVVAVVVVVWLSAAAAPIVVKTTLADVALSILRRMAEHRYPHLDPDEALERVMVENANSLYYWDDQRREKESLAKEVEDREKREAESDPIPF